MHNLVLPLRDDGATRSTSMMEKLREIHWPTLAAGVILGVLAMQWFIARPLMSRVYDVQQELTRVNTSLIDLTGSRDDVTRTNDLLSQLRLQRTQFTVARQTLDEMRSLQQQISSEARHTTQSLAAVRQVGTLQKEILAGRKETDSATESLAILVELQNKVTELGQATPDRLTAVQRADEAMAAANQAVAKFAALQDQIGQISACTPERVAAVEAADRGYAAANESVAKFSALQDKVGQLAAVTPDRVTAIKAADEGLTEAKDAVARLSSLKTQAIAAAEQTAEANSAVNQLAELKKSIQAQAADIATAQAQLEQLITLKTNAITNGTNVPDAEAALTALTNLKTRVLNDGAKADSAQANADKLITLQDRLIDDGRLKLDVASDNLNKLIEMETKLGNETQQISTSLENLEILTDLQHEFSSHIVGLQSMRRELMELIMLESSVARAVKAVHPLAELSNLRRLNDNEVRAAARSIMEERSSRHAEYSPKPGADARLEAEEGHNVVVPTPPEN